MFLQIKGLELSAIRPGALTGRQKADNDQMHRASPRAARYSRPLRQTLRPRFIQLAAAWPRRPGANSRSRPRRFSRAQRWNVRLQRPHTISQSRGRASGP